MKTNGFIDKKISRHKTLPEVIAERLKQAIINGELKGGQQLKQDEIAKRFNASMIPVREALRILEVQGLVKLYPNKGAIVRELSVEEVEEIFDIRIMLEKGALKFAIDNLDHKEMEYGEYILKKMDVLVEEEHLSQLNFQFHNILYGASQKNILLELISDMHIKLERYMRIYLLNMGYHQTSQEEHYKMLEACKNKNKSLAIEILVQHMENAKQSLVIFLKSREN
ncbi:transcriptional regulator, GntR family [Anaerovirgula multivorans]|uniref:Transcriptional regulator, GntR family n=2 Tax=Anaerovirgula multivorans TaxID=312168 RepID=A0A239JMW4_9FIRM|nr:transcriptional regulator, GntR family [Anaerovirgula multivorans]